MVEGILVGVAVATIMIAISGMVKRMGIKTKTDIMESDIKEIKEGQQVIFQMMLPLLLCAKGQQPNGELKKALDLYNEYMIKR